MENETIVDIKKNDIQISQNAEHLWSALIDSLKEIKNLTPDTQGDDYSYISLKRVIDEIKPKLIKNELSFIQIPINNNSNEIGISTRIFHKSGQYIEFTVFVKPTIMKNANNSQQIGASITYMRRYALISFFGIAGDYDLDGVTENEKKNENQLNSEKKSLENGNISLNDQLYLFYDQSEKSDKQKIDIAMKGSDKAKNALITYLSNKYRS